jgi:hypothetical protein
MDGHIKENIGVLDQITALKWIKSNIQDFNGNPENILLIADQITSSIIRFESHIVTVKKT